LKKKGNFFQGRAFLNFHIFRQKMPQYTAIQNSRQRSESLFLLFGGQQVKINGDSDKERKRRYRDGLTYTQNSDRRI